MSERLSFLGWGLWTYRSVTTQANASGGAIAFDVKPGPGNAMIVMGLNAINSGTNSMNIRKRNEDDAVVYRLNTVASGAATVGSIPRTFSTTGTSDVVDSTPIEVRMFRGDDYLSIEQGGAGAQNDTLTITIEALLSESVIPTITKSRSTNAGDVTISTPTVNKVL